MVFCTIIFATSVGVYHFILCKLSFFYVKQFILNRINLIVVTRVLRKCSRFECKSFKIIIINNINV